jgi:Brp/Blh family beta-carotene 15,15'-monooxygenase
MEMGTEKERGGRTESWYQRWRYGHTVVSVILTLLVIFCYSLFVQHHDSTAPSTLEMMGMLIAVSFFGVPHGATDHLVASDIFKDAFPRTWLLVFIALYLALMGIVVLAWNLFPSASLVIFLFMTIVHWGLGDVEDDLIPSHLRYPAVCLALIFLPTKFSPARVTKPGARARQILVHGAIPIVLPCVAFRSQVGAIFTWLIAPANATASTGAASAADASVVAVLDVMQVGSGRSTASTIVKQ